MAAKTSIEKAEWLEPPLGGAFIAHKSGWEYLYDDLERHKERYPEEGTPAGCWKSFWVQRVWRGKEPTLAQIQVELSDYHAMMGDVATVYSEVTGGRVSYSNTRAYAVIREYEDVISKEYEASLAKIKHALRSQEIRAKFLPDFPEEDVEHLAAAIIDEWYGADD